MRNNDRKIDQLAAKKMAQLINDVALKMAKMAS
jgi:hypothetical protein